MYQSVYPYRRVCSQIIKHIWKLGSSKCTSLGRVHKSPDVICAADNRMSRKHYCCFLKVAENHSFKPLFDFVHQGTLNGSWTVEGTVTMHVVSHCPLLPVYSPYYLFSSLVVGRDRLSPDCHNIRRCRLVVKQRKCETNSTSTWKDVAERATHSTPKKINRDALEAERIRCRFEPHTMMMHTDR
jgi:hypothetical protein